MNCYNLQVIRYLFYYLLVVMSSCNVKDNSNQDTLEAKVLHPEYKLNQDVEIIGLLYHRFGEEKYPSTNISIPLFRQQLTYLKQNNIRVISLSKAIKKLKSNEEKGRYVVITIDDAFHSFLNDGFPVLNEFGFEATLFINTETVGSGDYLGWSDLQYLNDHGIEIGNHTHSHAYFLDMDIELRQQAFVEDIKSAQKIIEEKLGIDPKIFAYPFGEYDNEMKEELKKMGFTCAAAQNSGVMSSYSDLFALPRFPMTDVYGKMSVFKEKINMKALPVIKTIPNSTIASENPPVLEISIEKNNLQFDQMQCFVQGGNCMISPRDSLGLSYQIMSDRVLTTRRALYTITVPDKKNMNWYWFSYQWIFPDTQ